jgi:hypothetical protein
MPLYDIKENLSKEVRWPYIVIGVLLAIIILFGALFITSSIRADRLRRSNNELTERLADATNSCTELAGQLSDCRGTIEQCRVYCRDIDEISERSIRTSREAIEIIEETRYYVMCLEVELGLIDTDSIYERLDSWLESEQVDFIK